MPDGSAELQQGDVLHRVPFAYFSLTDARVALEDGSLSRRDLSQSPVAADGVVARMEFGWGLVLSQTCDVQADPSTGDARRPVLVARVMPIQNVVSDFRDGSVRQSLSAVANLANPGKTPTFFYLPAYRTPTLDFPKAGADLLDLQRFPRHDLSALKRLVRLRLTAPALQALQERCAYCFGRFGAPDDLFYSPEEWAERLRQQEERRVRQAQ